MLAVWRADSNERENEIYVRRAMLRVVLFFAPLGLDTLAIAVALGLRGVGPLRPALAFALFETLMPLIGLLLRHVIGERFATDAVLVGAVVLVLLGLHALGEALGNEDETKDLSFATSRSTVLAGLAISTDELAVGFPMGAARLPIGAVLVAIGVQAFVVTYVGIAAGRRLGTRTGVETSRIAGIVAGGAFVALGIYLAAEQFIPSLPSI